MELVEKKNGQLLEGASAKEKQKMIQEIRVKVSLRLLEDIDDPSIIRTHDLLIFMEFL